MVISPRVTSPHATDFSSLGAMLASPRLAGKQGQELAIALWELVVDKHEGLYHYCPPLERLTGHFVYDPLKLLNVFGWSICGLTANLLAVLYRAAGFADARIANLKGHEATEVLYGGGWHLFDGDLQAFHRRHPPRQDAIASYEECLADSTLVSHQQHPSAPYYLPDRPPERMAELYRVEPSYDLPFADHSHTMDFVLRPGESLARSARPLGKWIWFANFGEFRERWPSEWCDDGPWERFPPHRRYGNGLWLYEPKLTDGFRDFELGVLEANGLEPGKDGVATTRRGECWCTFEFASPYVFAGVPTADGPEGGCLVEATVSQAAGSAARLCLGVDPDLPWRTVWKSSEAGSHALRLDLTRHVVNAYRYLLRFEFDAPRAGACSLERLSVASSVMVAPGSLGRLVEGENFLTLRFGDERGLPTRRWLIEINFLAEDDLLRKAYQIENLRFVPDSPDRIVLADPARDYEIVFKVEAPPHGRLHRLYAFGSFRGKAPDDPVEGRVAAYLAESEGGPWRPIFQCPVLAERHRWHFSAQGERELAERQRAAFVKLVGKVGMNAARVRVHWLETRAEAVRAPLVVTHGWQEDGGGKWHRERVEDTSTPQRYAITCGPRPRLESVTMQVESLPR